MNEFNEIEFKEICKRFNTAPKLEEITLNYHRDGYFLKVKEAVEKDRRGEVVFCVIRHNGKIITVTCSEYPEGVFRIPTGGIGHSEDIVDAVSREASEELGLITEIEEFAGAIKIRFEHKNESVMFYSYIFILKEIGGRLLLDASDDEVSEIREVDLAGLQDVINTLENIDEVWSDWGRFRSITSGAVLRYLKNRK